MNLSIKIRTNSPPCKHTVVTVVEDGEVRETVFHDSDFDNDEFVPEDGWKEIYKVIEERLRATGKKLSDSKKDFDGKVLTTSIIEKDKK